MTTIESRSEWGAKPSKGSTFLASTRGVKAHYTGGHVDPATLSDHAACRSAVRGIQNGHMGGNGWNDIGYSMVVCNHNVAMVARGRNVLPAANGPGLNAGHYAILLLVGNSGVTEPTDNMKLAFHGARDYLSGSPGNAGAEILGHRDGYNTDCPGTPIYGWVSSGAKLPQDVNPEPPVAAPAGGHMQYSSFGLDSEDAYTIPPNEWTDVKFRLEFADPDNDHVTGLNATILKGDPSIYSLEFGATLVAPGAVVEVRTVEYLYSAGPPAVDNLVEIGDPTACLITPDSYIHHSAVGSVQEGRKLRVQIRHSVPSETPVQLIRARARLIFQK